MTSWDPELALLEKYRAERESARLDFREARDRVQRAQRMIESLESVIPSEMLDGPPMEPRVAAVPMTRTLSSITKEEGLRGKEAVAAILKENQGTPFTPAELAAELELRGWMNPKTKNPAATARAAANRLREDKHYALIDGGFVFNPFFVGAEDEQP